MNIASLVLELVVLVVLFALSAFFSSAESIFLSLSAVALRRLREKDARSAERVALLQADPNRLISTVLVGNTLVNVAIASLGYSVISRFCPWNASLVSVLVITTLLLLFGEVGPKRIALIYAERLAPLYVGPVLFFERLLTPLRLLLEAITDTFCHLFHPERRTLNDEEILTAVEVGTEMGEIDREEYSMVDGILRLSEMQAHDVMTPRVDLECLDLDDPPERHLELARATSFSYLPLYRKTPDAIEGFLDVARFLLDPDHDFDDATLDALFVPETAALDDLLITLQRGNHHIAIVLDEYGGTAGLLSRSDILEIVTDDVPDSPDDDIPEIRPVGPRKWEIDGDTSLEEINHELDLDLEDDGADRIGGWVTAQAGRFLGPGEEVESQGVRVRVLRKRKVRIRSVLLEILDRPTADQAQESADLADNEIPADPLLSGGESPAARKRRGSLP
jgi:putative hemolysin